jgi:hypothetical protein
MKSRLKIRAFSKRAKLVMLPSVILVAINFSIFVLGSLYLGGDALNGHVQSGHYYVCAHGSCTEVSSKIWLYSYWHALTAIGGIVLVFIEAGVFMNTGDIKWE